MSEAEDGDFPGHLLHQASLWDNAELLIDLLRGDLGSEIESQDSWGRTALHAAATTHDSRCLEVLLKHGANPNAVSGGQDNFKTPLHTTAEFGFLSNVKRLVQAGADVSSLEGRALTAADLALRGAHMETYNFLIEFTKDKEVAREDLHTSLREVVTRGDVKTLTNLLRPISASDRKELLNKTPHGTQSLLFIACESGNLELVDILLENGSDGRIHPVTKYSPMYIASYHGHRTVVSKLLEKFPALAKSQTVEKWLPIHVCCIHGHTAVLDLLLNFNYPSDLLTTFKDEATDDEFEMVFDINQKDVSDQTCLYIACQMANPRLVDILLEFRVSKKGAIVHEATSPTKGKVSEGIQGIIKRLSFSMAPTTATQPRKDLICPVNVNLYCEEYQTALHLAVKARHHGIATSLLSAGADPNLPILAPTSIYIITTGDPKAEARHESSALAEACKNRDLGMIDLLLKHGARDEDSIALSISCRDDVILGKLLTLKAYADAEGILHTEEIQQNMREGSGKKLLATSLLPKVPVNVNWHAQRLTKVSETWLVSAGVKLNPKLRLAPGRGETMGLQAITRLDLSNNQLDSIPSCIFKLSSLVYLNLSGNKITKITLPSRGPLLIRLQELLMQENRIDECPAALFTNFPSLVTINLSNNKFDSLPSTMWLAPKLQDLNVSLNLIADLPQGPQTEESQRSSRHSTDSEKQIQKRRRSSSRSRRSCDSVSHEAMWRTSVTIGEEADEEQLKAETQGNSIQSLNLSHNSFTKVPAALACWANRIQRLSMAFNSLKEMGSIGDYPASLRHLDLSQNKIRSWFSCSESNGPSCCVDPTVLCPHRNRFRRLDNLKTIILSGNALTSLEISFDDQLMAIEGRKPFVWFPNLTTLDLSKNKLSELSPRISSLTLLSVLNLSGNKDLGELPPQIGLLSRIWNLNLQGCKLQEPLKSLVERKGSKTIDVMGYLKSVLEDARPYARMKLMTVGVHGIGKTSLLNLLRQEGTGKGSDTWTKRMGNTPSKGGKLMSTVGVDIGCLTLEKGNRGPVTFRTWDFGGQKEYYATHSYFLSKRSLYLLLWNICDGEKGLREVHAWLVNIQGRAPNSPVIIVGTHYDLVSEKFPPGYLDYLEQKIREKFICVSDPEKRGLPRVLTSLEISCRTKYNIKNLSTVIYDAAVTLKTSNGKFLLEQHVPSKYIHLEEIVTFLASERKSRGQDPVLTEEEFKAQASMWLESNYGLKFRDDAEIAQACTFLHENGILLHFGELYFLDPQWLCDVLANVVTIREINPFCQGGSMRIQDLAFLFKGRSKATQDYILDLLSKFELAIPYDGANLLIPSLLPTPEQMKMGQNEVRVKVSLRSRAWMLQQSREWRESQKLDQREPCSEEVKVEPPVWRPERKELGAITRFLMLSYFPSGFWPRLMSRILSDDRVIEILRHYFTLPPPTEVTSSMVALLDQPAEWLCWQTGLELKYGELTLIRIREVTGSDKPHTFMLRRDDEGDLAESTDESAGGGRQEETCWDAVDLNEAGLLEIHLPCLSLSLETVTEEPASVLNPSIESVTKLLTLGVEAVDNLLEDWYPSIGTRFVHTSEGKYLVTRICPCPACFSLPTNEKGPSTSNSSKTKSMSSDSGVGHSPLSTNEADAEVGPGNLRLRTGLAFETPRFGGHGQSAGLNFFLGPETRNLGFMTRNFYAWTIENIILEAQTSEFRIVKCPKHGEIHLSSVAPDILFYDLPKRYLLNSDELQRKQLLGRGAFGFVFGGTLKGTMDVAIKSFHPIDPGDANEEAQSAYKAAKTKWCRSPTQSACRAYLASRGEIRVLYWVSHPNIVPLLGLLQTSLSIVMPRAPRGALDTILADYARSGDFVSPPTVQQSIIQVAKALEYLHGHKILYRDLKAENVLVWAFPAPFSRNDYKTELKLADYGISRSALPTGNKGFGGTEGFIAPEVIRFNGEEEYTELVDTFSLGMVIFQILSLKQPYDGCENIKESILEGVRPAMVKPERYPMYMLDLMVACWQNLPKDRPTAAKILRIASSPEFVLLRDVVSVGTPPETWELNVVTSLGLDDELWVSCSTGTIYSLQVREEGFASCEAFAFIPGAVTAMARVRNQVWMGDISSNILIFQLEGERISRELELKSIIGQSLGACISIQAVGALVAVAFSSGRLFLVNGETGDLVTELGQASTLHSLVPRSWEGSNEAEIWTGENSGVMRIFSLLGAQVVGQETISHDLADEVSSDCDAQVLLLNTHPKKEFLFSYLFPGSVIYCWNGDKREITASADIQKLLNNCEGPDPMMCKTLHLTALHSTDEFVFVGTNTGFIVLLTLKFHHISTFHPFSKDVRSFCVYSQASPGQSLLNEQNIDTEDETAANSEISARLPTRLIAFGKNYVHLFDTNSQEQRRAYAILCTLNLK